jgi:hypothetical protein
VPFSRDAVWTGAAPDDSKSQLITALSPRRGNLDETIAFLEGSAFRQKSGAAPTVLTRLAVVPGERRGGGTKPCGSLDESCRARSGARTTLARSSADLLFGLRPLPR